MEVRSWEYDIIDIVLSFRRSRNLLQSRLTFERS